jgi:hypothetical protein
LWQDVLVTWSNAAASSSGRLKGPALALAIALPIAFGVVLLAGSIGLAWWCRRKRR